MRPVRVTMEGFRLFRERVEIDLEAGAYYILGRNHDDVLFDSNGGGKTTLCSAFPWAYFGVIATGAQKDEVINWDSDTVEVEVVHDDGFVINRSKRRKHAEVLRYYRDGQWHQPDLKIAQAEIKKYLGLSEDLFFNSIWIGKDSTSAQFLRAIPSKRLELLEEILMSSLFERCRKVASQRTKDLEAKVASLRQDVDRYNRQEQDQKVALLRSQAQYNEEAEKVSARTRQLSHRSAELHGQAAQIRQVIAESVVQPAESLAAEQTSLREAIQLVDYKTGAAAQQARNNVVEACPTCKRPFAPEDVQHQHAVASEARRILAELAVERAALQARFETIQQKMSDSRVQAETLRGKQQQLRDIEDQIKGLDFDPGAGTLAAFKQSIDEATEQIRGIQKNRDAANTELQGHLVRLPFVKFWETGFGSRGLRNLLLDDVRKTMAAYAAVYSKQLAGEEMQIELPEAADRFDILLHHKKGVADISTFSTGTAWRGHLAMLIALRETLHFLNSTKLDMLVLDDPCGDVDLTGQRAIVELAERLADRFGLVFVTMASNVPGVPPDQTVVVERRGGHSHIVGGND